MHTVPAEPAAKRSAYRSSVLRSSEVAEVAGTRTPPFTSMDAVTALVSPAWALALLLATLNVLVFRIALAREGHSALYFLPFGVFGFAAGNLLGVLLNSPLPTLGDVRLIEACIGAWIFLSLANAREAQ